MNEILKREVERLRKHSREDLKGIVARNKNPAVTERRAAEFLLDEMAKEEQNSAAELNRAQTERHHRERQRLAGLALWISLGAFLFSLVAFLLTRYWPTTQVSALEQRIVALERGINELEQTSAVTAINQSLHEHPKQAGQELNQSDKEPSEPAKSPTHD